MKTINSTSKKRAVTGFSMLAALAMTSAGNAAVLTQKSQCGKVWISC